MLRVLAVPDHLRSVPFRGSAAVRDGALTPAQLRRRCWLRLFPDVYVHRDVEVTHELRARAAGALLFPDDVVTGVSAAVLWGVPLANAVDDVEVTRWRGSHPVRVPGMHVRRAELEDRTVVWDRGVHLTTPEATAVRLAAALPLDDAVAAVDQLVVAGAQLDEVRWQAGIATGPGCRRARRAVALADGLAGSPQETRVRLLIGRSSLPVPVAQFEVRHDGRFVARVDFAWPAQRLALEYDGLWHAEPGQFGRDRERLNRLTAAGWRVVFVTSGDLRCPEQLIARIAAALAGVQ
ncbi:endonuclease domain-containing protein [Modestobacter sp. SYSU DS0875]